METVFRHRTIAISLIVAGLALSHSLRRIAAQPVAEMAAQTSRIENTTALAPASDVTATPRRIIMDDPPPREAGLKRRAQTIVSFGLLVVTFLILIVGIGVLRAFRQR